MVVLGGLYVVEQRTVALQDTSGQDVPQLNELSPVLQFSTNHVQFINLLTVSLRGATGEGHYRAGREVWP
jgi:hypothetical protein